MDHQQWEPIIIRNPNAKQEKEKKTACSSNTTDESRYR